MLSKFEAKPCVSGGRTFYRAERRVGNKIIARGGLWDTEQEASVVARNLNDSMSIQDDIFQDGDEVFIDDDIDEF